MWMEWLSFKCYISNQWNAIEQSLTYNQINIWPLHVILNWPHHKNSNLSILYHIANTKLKNLRPQLGFKETKGWEHYIGKQFSLGCAIFKINGAGGDFLNNIATNPFFSILIFKYANLNNSFLKGSLIKSKGKIQRCHSRW